MGAYSRWAGALRDGTLFFEGGLGGGGRGGVVYAALAANTLFYLHIIYLSFYSLWKKIILNFSDSLPSPKQKGPSLRLGAYCNKYGKHSLLKSLNLPAIRFSTKVPYHLKIS